jgi:hypothetical protein
MVSRTHPTDCGRRSLIEPLVAQVTAMKDGVAVELDAAGSVRLRGSSDGSIREARMEISTLIA